MLMAAIIFYTGGYGLSNLETTIMFIIIMITILKWVKIQPVWLSKEINYTKIHAKIDMHLVCLKIIKIKLIVTAWSCRMLLQFETVTLS